MQVPRATWHNKPYVYIEDWKGISDDVSTSCWCTFVKSQFSCNVVYVTHMPLNWPRVNKILKNTVNGEVQHMFDNFVLN